jgi:hypothetical protein
VRLDEDKIGTPIAERADLTSFLAWLRTATGSGVADDAELRQSQPQHAGHRVDVG